MILCPGDNLFAALEAHAQSNLSKAKMSIALEDLLAFARVRGYAVRARVGVCMRLGVRRGESRITGGMCREVVDRAIGEHMFDVFDARAL